MMNNPVIIEFAGLPRAGKTTAANGLKTYLKEQGINVVIVKERAGICPIKDKLHPNFNLWTTTAFLKEFIVAKDNNVQVLISDRGLYDAMIWVELFCQNNKYQKEYDSFYSLMNLPILQEIRHESFFLYCDIDIAEQREFERSLVKRRGRIKNPEMLKSYMASYVKVCVTRKPTWEIDTTKMPLPEMLSTIYNKINIL